MIVSVSFITTEEPARQEGTEKQARKANATCNRTQTEQVQICTTSKRSSNRREKGRSGGGESNLPQAKKRNCSERLVLQGSNRTPLTFSSFPFLGRVGASSCVSFSHLTSHSFFQIRNDQNGLMQNAQLALCLIRLTM